MQHDSERASLTWHSFSLQQREQQILLFAVVAAISKEFKKFQQSGKQLRRCRHALVDSGRDLFDRIQHAKDCLMFVTQGSSGLVHNAPPD